MGAIDDDAMFFAQFSTEASNSAIDAIDDALAMATGARIEQAQKDAIAKVLLEGFQVVRAAGCIGHQDSDTGTRVLAALNLHEEGSPGALIREVRQEVLRAFGNFAESLAAFCDRELKRREQRSAN